MRRRRRERLVELLCSYECRRRGALGRPIYSRGTLELMWVPVPSRRASQSDAAYSSVSSKGTGRCFEKELCYCGCGELSMQAADAAVNQPEVGTEHKDGPGSWSRTNAGELLRAMIDKGRIRGPTAAFVDQFDSCPYERGRATG